MLFLLGLVLGALGGVFGPKVLTYVKSKVDPAPTPVVNPTPTPAPASEHSEE